MKRSRILSLLTGLLLLVVPGVASAETALDGVDLKNGGMLRGTIVSLEPGKEVVILIQGTQDRRRVPWAEVARVKRGDEAPSAPPPPPPPPPPGYPPAVGPMGPADGAPRVHIQSTTPGVGLHEVVTQIAVVGYGGTAYGQITRPVCMAPCDRVVDGRDGQLFFFAGDGITPSSRFQLAGLGPDVVAEVDAGSRGLRVGGIWMSSFGLAGVLTGITFLALGANQTTLDASGDFVHQANKSMMTGGGAALGLGAAFLVGGIVMAVQGTTRHRFLTPEGAQVGANPLKLSF